MNSMMVKSALLCIFLLISSIAAYYTCPQICLCNFNFTDCKYNELTVLPDEIDSKVTVLDLSQNNFRIFPAALNYYSSLISLNLSHNKIQSLNDGTFSKLRNLKFLDLSHNKFSDWMDIRSRAFDGTKSLFFLDFSHNQLRSFPFEKNPLHIASLEILMLKNCSISHLNNKIFENLSSLKELHVSENPIKYLQVNFVSHSLKFLDLSRCNLEYISPSAFINLTALETLTLYQNIHLKTFPCHSSSLLYLDLSDCNLEEVPTGSLEKVYLANFHGNHFRRIPKTSFIKFPDLKFLDLSYNTLSSIEGNAFSRLLYIESIDLSSNTLSNLDNDLFHANSKLTYLNLSRNYFSNLPSFNSTSLEVLDLSSCEIPAVERDSLMDLPKLKVLILKKNMISHLPDNFNSESLNSLDVSVCRIKSINNKTFEHMPSLRHLNLAHNSLTTITPESVPKVVFLDISDNPWRCDCASLKEMYIWLSNTGKRIDNLLCQSPDEYAGYSWFSACKKDWYPANTRSDSVWWYTTGLIITVFLILFVILAMRRMYLLKEKRMRQAIELRRAEERESLRRMQRMQAEIREETSRNAPDPRELQSPPSYNEALLLPRLDSSHPSLCGSLHSLASKHSINGSLPDVAKRNRPRRKRRRRKLDSSEGQHASQVVVDSDTASEPEQPQPRVTLESDF